MNKITILKIVCEQINDPTFGITECDGGYFIPIISVDATSTLVSCEIYKLNIEIKIYY